MGTNSMDTEKSSSGANARLGSLKGRLRGRSAALTEAIHDARHESQMLLHRVSEHERQNPRRRLVRDRTNRLKPADRRGSCRWKRMLEESSTLCLCNASSSFFCPW